MHAYLWWIYFDTRLEYKQNNIFFKHTYIFIMLLHKKLFFNFNFNGNLRGETGFLSCKKMLCQFEIVTKYDKYEIQFVGFQKATHFSFV